MRNIIGISQTKRLPDLAADVFMLILQLRASGSNLGEPEGIGKRIVSFIDSFERKARKSGFTQDEMHQAKFALVAFIDETLIASGWDKKEDWLSNPLQVQLFNRFDAGDEFFQKLIELRKQIDDRGQVLEVYYLCLALGFKGKYAVVEQDRLRVIIDETYHDLRRVRGKAARVLSPHGKRKEEITEVIKKDVPVGMIAVGAAALGFILYVILVILSNRDASRTAEFINGLM